MNSWVGAYFCIISVEMAYGKHIVGPHLGFTSLWGPTLYANSLSLLPMAAIGLDFAAFWGMLIFFLNFIPTVGSILATVFPSLLAVIVFESPAAIIGVIGGITGIQLLVGNFMEPKLMGNSLNLSPLVILLSLSLWGSLWGIPGMFLCVPITVIAMIICSHFAQTRPVAIFLSGNGRLKSLD